MSMEQAIKDLQDAVTVMAHIEKRQSEMLKEHSERIVALEEAAAEANQRSAKLQERIETNLAEITDKLNGLIGYLDHRDHPSA